MIRNIKKMFILFSILSITPFMRGCSPKITFGFPFPIITVPFDTRTPWGFVPDLRSMPLYYLYNLYSYNGIQNILISITALALNLLIVYLLVKSFIAKEKNREKAIIFLYALFINLCFDWSILFPSYLKFIHIYYIWMVPFYIITLMDRCGLYDLQRLNTDILMDFLIRIWFIIITVLLARLLYSLKKNKNEQVT